MPYEAHERLRSHRVWTSPESCGFRLAPDDSLVHLFLYTNTWMLPLIGKGWLLEHRQILHHAVMDNLLHGQSRSVGCPG